MFLFQVAEPRNIKTSGAAVIKRARLANQILDDARDARAHQVFAEVVPDVVARIPDPVRVSFRFGEQKQPRALEGGRRDDNRLAAGFIRLAGIGIDERDAARFA